jgi:hypothetical protein
VTITHRSNIVHLNDLLAIQRWAFGSAFAFQKPNQCVDLKVILLDMTDGRVLLIGALISR